MTKRNKKYMWLYIQNCVLVILAVSLIFFTSYAIVECLSYIGFGLVLAICMLLALVFTDITTIDDLIEVEDLYND